MNAVWNFAAGRLVAMEAGRAVACWEAEPVVGYALADLLNCSERLSESLLWPWRQGEVDAALPAPLGELSGHITPE